MGVILYSSIFFATDLLSERYGKQEATRAVMIGFLVSIIFIVMVSLSLFYLPATSPETSSIALSMHEATATLFNFTPRFVIGSLLAYFIYLLACYVYSPADFLDVLHSLAYFPWIFTYLLLLLDLLPCGLCSLTYFVYPLILLTCLLATPASSTCFIHWIYLSTFSTC